MNFPRFGIGIDTGGTFTDIVLFDFQGARVVRKAKTPTTHGNYTVCIAKAFTALALEESETGGLQRVCLSTTLATNTVAENRVHPSCLLLEPGDIAVPEDVHPCWVRLRSQLSFDTMEVVAVSEREVLEKTAPHADRVESFAVSGYASTRSPAHEQQIAEILRAAYHKPVVQGSELTHQLNFLQRARAAALNAGLLPVIVEWLEAVKSILAGLRIDCPLYIVKGDGSLMKEEEALRRPVQTLFSGPAASLNGGWFLSGHGDAVVVDVGGTTTDMGRIRGGRGLLKRGGILINQTSIAVDGLELSTHGLGGDSRFRLGGPHRFYFENKRALPFCRVGEHHPEFSLDTLEGALADQWHFGDPSLVDMAALDTLRLGGKGAVSLTGDQLLLVEALQEGPLTIRALEQATAVAHPVREVDELVRQRVLMRIGFTPTDLFCAAGHIEFFDQAIARHALALLARMLDMEPEALARAAVEALRFQAAALLTSTLGAFEPPLAPEHPVLVRIVEMLLDAEGPQPALAMDPRQPVVLVGAAAPQLFAGMPGPLGRSLIQPEHGDVANAIGAVTSRFILRDTVTVEPLRRGGVEVFDHQGKTPFPTLAEGLAHGRALLEKRLSAQAEALGLADAQWHWNEEVLEDYADFSRRARKELVIARVEAILTAMPG